MQEGRDERSSRGPAFNGEVVLGKGVERSVGGLVNGADGEEDAGSLKAESRFVEAGCGDAGDFRTGG